MSPFGFKLAGVTTDDRRRDRERRRPARRHRCRSISAPTNPNAGDTVKFTFTLPDGTSRDLTLTATNSSPPGPGQFTIGATFDGDRHQSAGRPHPGPRHAGQHRAGGGVRGRGRQRFLQHRCHATRRSGSTARRSTPRPRWSTAPPPTPWPGISGDNATDDPRIDRACPRRPVADGGLWRARQRAGLPHRGAEPRGVRGDAVLGLRSQRRGSILGAASSGSARR